MRESIRTRALREADVPDRPNFLIFMTDQHRFDHLGCYWQGLPGGRPTGALPIQTPAFDSLASEGVYCDHAYVNNPLCMPSRSTLLTGLTPRGHGVRTNGINLRADLPTTVDAVRQAGYRTHSVGKIHARTYWSPNGVDLADIDASRFSECRQLWEDGRVAGLPSPYYGFETTEFTGAHVATIFGDYLNWLRREHPGAERLLSANAGTKPANGAEQTYTMALPAELHYNNWIADRTIAFLDQAAAPAREGQPFMVWCSFPDPHHPFAAPEPWASMYDRARIPLPRRRDGELADLPPHFGAIYERGFPLSGRFDSTRATDDQLREIIAMTCGMVSHVDHEAGRVLAALDRLGLSEDTVVVFMADHGDMLGDHWLINKGPFHFDGLLRVPYIWRWPGRFPAGRRVSSLASLLDFAPTILDLAGVPIPEGETPLVAETDRMPLPWPGRSMRAVLDGTATRTRDAALVENDEDYLGLRLRTLVTETHQLTMYVGDDGEQPYGELFDLRADPGELRNLWSDPTSRQVKLELKARLLAEIVATDSVLPRRLCHA